MTTFAGDLSRIYVGLRHMVRPSHRLSYAKHMRRPRALSQEPPMLNLTANKMGPDSYACSLSWLGQGRRHQV